MDSKKFDDFEDATHFAKGLSSKKICSNCGGDGGIRGGCGKCFGKGWVDEEKVDVRKIVEIKNKNTSN